MIKCVIIDDEPLAIQLLADYVEKSKDLTLCATFSNPIESLHFLDEEAVDLLLLDVQMPELTGIQLMKITNGKYHIILTTAYHQYALDSYDFDVVDYLLKPISLDRFMLAIEKLKKRISPQVEKSSQATSSSKSYIFVKSGYKTLKINLADILRLEGLGDYVGIFLPNEKILTLENLGYFENILPTGDFMRVHRSHIVSLSQIEYIERNRIVIGDSRIPISASYQKAFWERVQE